MRGFLWEKGRLRDLGSLGSRLQTGPSAVNNRGQIVGRAVHDENNG